MLGGRLNPGGPQRNFSWANWEPSTVRTWPLLGVSGLCPKTGNTWGASIQKRSVRASGSPGTALQKEMPLCFLAPHPHLHSHQLSPLDLAFPPPCAGCEGSLDGFSQAFRKLQDSRGRASCGGRFVRSCDRWQVTGGRSMPSQSPTILQGGQIC